MYETMIQALEKPSLYAKSTIPFWDDEHISRQMLDAHLNPNFEGASRKIEFINRSVDWIREVVPPAKYRQLLDIGCGPGIYAEKFTQAGYEVTGVDFSKRSIDYAKETATKHGLDIRYFYQNYLHLNLKSKFDVATLIYCDYGALSTSDRQIVMKNIYEHLKPGGRFLLDVFSMAEYHNFPENQTWEICTDGGFWSSEKYISFHGQYKYSDNVTLKQTSIISHKGVSTYYIWDTYFTKESLISEAQGAGFRICDVFEDVAGNKYSTTKPTIAILLEK